MVPQPSCDDSVVSPRRRRGDSAVCPLSGNGKVPLKPGSLILICEVVPHTERWGKGGMTVSCGCLMAGYKL